MATDNFKHLTEEEIRKMTQEEQEEYLMAWAVHIKHLNTNLDKAFRELDETKDDFVMHLKGKES